MWFVLHVHVQQYKTAEEAYSLFHYVAKMSHVRLNDNKRRRRRKNKIVVKT